MKAILLTLSEIQTKLKAPKGQTNSFGKYKYRSCEDILESVKPLLTEHKCVLIIGDELVLIGDRYYVKAMATLYDCDTGENINGIAYAREEETKKGMDASQITGTASSYARKYALNGLLCIDDTKDADTLPPREDDKKTDKEAEEEAEKLRNSPITESNLKILKDTISTKVKGVDIKIKKEYGVIDFGELTQGQFVEAMRRLELTPIKKDLGL